MIEAYAWPPSVLPGESFDLRLSTDHGSVDVEVAREGAERHVVRRLEKVRGSVHQAPDDASARGCDWPSAATIEIPADTRSGYHAVTVSAGDERADAFVVVRPPPGRAAPILLALSTPTWNAYNDWGGPSLYTGGTRVAFNRPLARGFLVKPEPARRKMQPHADREARWFFEWAEPLGLSVWSGGAGWWNWERAFVRWAASRGFDVDVATGPDLEQHPEVLDGHRLFVSVGHDEYWSWGMRDAVEGFVGAGGNAAFFTGNTCFWQVRFEDDGRMMTCFKYRADEDPVRGTGDERFLSGVWADRRVGRPENAMTGLSFTRGGYARYGLGVPRGSGGFTVWRPEHWAFEGTDLRYGDLLGGADAIAAYELDGCELTMIDGVPVPTHEDGTPAGFEVLATTPARLWNQEEQPTRYAHEPGELENVAASLFGDEWRDQMRRVTNNHAVIGSFTRPGGGTTFSAGCTDWACGIEGGDPDVLRMTENVVRRLST